MSRTVQFGAGASASYSGFAMLLHWLVAACVLFIIPAGIVMVNLGPGDLQNNLYNLHRSFGALVLALMAIRTGYRLLHGAPASEPTITAFHRNVSWTVHMAFYVLLLAQPLIGWAGTSAFGATISVFGLFDLPHLLAKDEALSKQLLYIHKVLGFTIAALVALHIGAAFYHYLIRRDGVLARMLP